MKVWDEYKWNFWDPKLEPLPESPKNNYHITVITTCRNRVSDLKQTLLRNIKDNEDYKNLEFIVLNYNSQDDMDDYMLGPEIKPYIENGKVKYIRTRFPKFYEMGHSRNVCIRASQDNSLITSVDADNFTGKGFVTYLNKMANASSNPQKTIYAKGKKLSHGRISLFKGGFESIGSYDQELSGYGNDDASVMYRAMAMGFKFMWWSGSPVDFTRRIKTPRSKVGECMVNPRWRETEAVNKQITMTKLKNKEFVANIGVNWGYVPDLEIVS